MDKKKFIISRWTLNFFHSLNFFSLYFDVCICQDLVITSKNILNPTSYENREVPTNVGLICHYKISLSCSHLLFFMSRNGVNLNDTLLYPVSPFFKKWTKPGTLCIQIQYNLVTFDLLISSFNIQVPLLAYTTFIWLTSFWIFQVSIWNMFCCWVRDITSNILS